MQDRMMAVGGRLTLDSEIGAGTTVRARVGLTQPVALPSEAAPSTKDRPEPTIKNWSWLGQRLVIPVGQTWPWLPADETHLRQPLIEPGDGPLAVRPKSGFLNLGRHYRIELQSGRRMSLRVYPHRAGFHWQQDHANWVLRYVRAPKGIDRAVLMRNRQPLAALQSQGRLLNRWIELVYDGHGYQIVPDRSPADEGEMGRSANYLLQDQDGETLLRLTEHGGLQAQICRALPLPLLATVLMQTLVHEPIHTRKEEPK
jgi:hypothetical protein